MLRSVVLVLLLLAGTALTGDEATSQQESFFSDEEKSYWAFQPIVHPAVPANAESDWALNPIDSFVLSRLRDTGLEPSPPASKATWLRRVYFDLVGLPPTPEQIDAFLSDTSEYAFEKVVDQLLASPRYGERWGRHWLDVVRYSDTTGQEADWVMRYAWRYRDYVLNAFNYDKPYDQFVIEQLAGDLLPAEGDFDAIAERIVATGFLMLSPKATAEADKELMELDIVDEQIDVSGRAFLGLTIACARCHDHKFDPIPTMDYYSIAGIFRSTRTMVDRETTSMWSEYPLEYVPNAEERKQLDAYAARIEALTAQIAERERASTPDQKKWEEQLFRDVIETFGGDSAIAKIIDKPFAERTAEETAQLETALAAADNGSSDGLLLPDALDGLYAWYKIDAIAPRDEDAPVPAWIDSSSNPRGLNLMTEAGYEPRYRQKGYQDSPAVHFRYMSGLMRTTVPLGFFGDQNYTAFFAVNVTKSSFGAHPQHQPFRWGQANGDAGGILLEIDSTTTDFERLDLATGNSNDAHSGKVTIGKPQIWSVRYGGGPIANHEVSIDGQPQKITPNGRAKELRLKVKDDELLFGGPTGAEMNVAEVVIFDRKLNDDEEQAIGYYLQQKYSLESEYKPPTIARLVAKPEEVRSAGEKATLKRYYLSNRDAIYRDLSGQLTQVRSLKSDLESSRPPLVVMAVKDHTDPKDIHVYRRGDYNQPREPAPRRFLQIVAGENHQPIQTQGSGRLELARWIADSQHPLTARVLVNRLWQGHFDAGIVRSSDNFGVLGDRPTHPQLLDWLASRFVESGWSMKPIHRLIVLSNTYRQQSAPRADSDRTDPENKLLWRMPKRRLEAEIIRDAMLVASGSLETGVGGELENWWKEAQSPVDAKRGLIALGNPAGDLTAFESKRRSVYLPVSRNQLFEMFVLFDYADASSVIARRGETTVAPQALFMLNSRHVRRPARDFAESLLAARVEDRERVHLAHRRAFGRRAEAAEVAEALGFILSFVTAKTSAGIEAAEAQVLAWQSYAQVLFCQNEFVYVE